MIIPYYYHEIKRKNIVVLKYFFPLALFVSLNSLDVSEREWVECFPSAYVQFLLLCFQLCQCLGGVWFIKFPIQFPVAFLLLVHLYESGVQLPLLQSQTYLHAGSCNLFGQPDVLGKYFFISIQYSAVCQSSLKVL